MVKIGIVTLYYNNYNYGGQLQAYAMQRIFTTPNSEARLISYSTKSSGYFLHRVKDLGWKKTIISIMNKVHFKCLELNKDFRASINTRYKRFDDFINLSNHTHVYNEKTIIECNDIFDQFVCGSDQIWNPGWWNDILFLSFTQKRKYSYGASIARGELKNNEISYIAEKTNDFYAISVREQQAQKLLKGVVRKEVELVLDPTLIIDKKEWEKLVVKPEIEDKYVLFYMVGDSKGLKKKVYEFCKSKGYKIVSIGFSKNTYFASDVMYSDQIVIDAGPKEWLGLIKSAEYVFTDSFHGSVFSILFKRQFWCFERDNPNDKSNENSRLYNFLNITGLASRLLSYDTQISFNDEGDISFETVSLNLDPLVNASQQYINKCINGE